MKQTKGHKPAAYAISKSMGSETALTSRRAAPADIGRKIVRWAFYACPIALRKFTAQVHDFSMPAVGSPSLPKNKRFRACSRERFAVLWAF